MKQGFTLVEIMIVVAIIGLLAAIAIPSFVKSRDTTRKNTCVSNLRLIDSSKEQWALENNKNDADTVALSDLTSYFKGSTAPVCPQGSGAYTLTTVAANPACPNVGTYADHVLPGGS